MGSKGANPFRRLELYVLNPQSNQYELIVETKMDGSGQHVDANGGWHWIDLDIRGGGSNGSLRTDNTYVLVSNEINGGADLWYDLGLPYEPIIPGMKILGGIFKPEGSSWSEIQTWGSSSGYGAVNFVIDRTSEPGDAQVYI